MKEEDIRHQIRQQRQFYTQAIELGILNVVLLFTWILFDTSHVFWPKYVIFFSLLGLLIKGYQYGLYPFFAEKMQGVQNKFQFLSDAWEKQKIDEMLGKKPKKAKKPKATPKKSPKKAAQRKVVGRTKKSS